MRHSITIPKEALAVGVQVYVSVDGGANYDRVGPVVPNLGDTFHTEFADELAGKPALFKFARRDQDLEQVRPIKAVIGKQGAAQKDEA